MTRTFLKGALAAAAVTALTLAPDRAPEAGDTTAGPEAAGAIRLVYVEQEPGIEPYRSRYIVTDDFLRIDDDDQNGGFVLFDRRQRIIFSTNADNRSILEIHQRAATEEPPRALTLTHEWLPLEGAPDVGGRQAEYRRYSVNGETCLDQVSLPGLAPEMVAALVEFRQVLAGEHRRMVPLTPADMQDGCDLARHAFHVDSFMAHGLPLKEWDGRGNRRELVDMELDYRPAAGLFELPADYSTMDMGRLGGG